MPVMRENLLYASYDGRTYCMPRGPIECQLCCMPVMMRGPIVRQL